MNARAMHHGRVRTGLKLLVLTLAALVLGSPALAQRDRGAGASGAPHARGDARIRGDVARPLHGNRDAWRGGGWSRDRHGSSGWTLGIGGFWYGYPGPLYPYSYPYAYPYPYPYPYPFAYSYPYGSPYSWQPPAALSGPPVNVAPDSPPAQYWYYCDASGAYYPYVPACPGGWRPVPATPSDAAPVSPQ